MNFTPVFAVSFQPVLTEHAIERARQRMQWSEATLQRMARKALWLGVPHSRTRGRLRRYILQLGQQNQQASNIRLYGENVFLFSADCLITLWQLPLEFRSLARVPKAA